MLNIIIVYFRPYKSILCVKHAYNYTTTNENEIKLKTLSQKTKQNQN